MPYVIRRPTKEEVESLYTFGLTIPELQTSASEPFMDPEEFLGAILNPEGVFLVAEEQDKPIGFVYANTRDLERAKPSRWACLVYLAVAPQARTQGVASYLYEACIAELKNMGVSSVYSWAREEGSSAIQGFLAKRGFQSGHAYRWFDKTL